MIYKITLFLMLSTCVFSQVYLGNSTNTSLTNKVTLDIDFNGSLKINGIKVPIVSKQNLIDKRTINNNSYTYLYNQNHIGTFVYVNNISITSDIKETSNIVDNGIYYFDGSAWYGVSSELKDYSIFAVGDPQSLIPSERDWNIHRNISTKVSLSFNPNDKLADNIAVLGSVNTLGRIVTFDGNCSTEPNYNNTNYGNDGPTGSCDKPHPTDYYYFEIKEDGIYEISSYFGYNPNQYDSANTEGDISYVFTKTIMCDDDPTESLCNLKKWTSIDGVTEIASAGTLLRGKQLVSVATLTTPKTIAKLKAGNRLYFYLIVPDIIMDGISNRGFYGFTQSGQRFDNVTKTSNNIDYLQFSKFVSIRKL